MFHTWATPEGPGPYEPANNRYSPTVEQAYSSPLLESPSGPLRVAELSADKAGAIALSIVIPTYNEAQNIAALVATLTSLLDAELPAAYEVIVVDDDSPDRTWELAEKLAHSHPQLSAIRRTEERGLSTAIVRGWQVSQGDVLGVIDGDLQHPPAILLKLWREIENGCDLAIASRHVSGGGVSDWNIVRRLLSRGAQTLGVLVLPEVAGRLSDPMSGYLLVRRRCIAGRLLRPSGYKIAIEVVARGKIRSISEVGYVFQERSTGESKVTWKQYAAYLYHLAVLRAFLWTRFFKFAVVGGSGVFVDMAIFHLLRSLGLGLTASAALSAEVAIFNNFIWNDFWTFRDASNRQPGSSKRWKRFIKFNAICSSGLLAHILLLNLAYNILGVNQYAAKLIAIVAIALWNYCLSVRLGWRTTEQ